MSKLGYIRMAVHVLLVKAKDAFPYSTLRVYPLSLSPYCCAAAAAVITADQHYTDIPTGGVDETTQSH